MTKHIDRLMSRASVAAMAAFAPKPEPASTVPDFAERVDEAAPSAGSHDPLGGLTAEEQAQVDAMNSGTSADVDNVEHGADAAAPGDGAADGDDDDGDDPAADAVAAPAADGTAAPRQPPRTISYGRHQKEIAKAQKERDDLQAQLDGARKETAAEREQRVVLNTRTQMLLEAINTKPPAAAAAPAADADPEPNVDEDPLGHALWGNRQLRKRLDAVEQGQTRQQEETVAQQRERQAFEVDEQILAVSTQEISSAAVDKPEVAEAFLHWRESRYTELGYALAGIDINDVAQCATLPPEKRMELSDRIQAAFRGDCLTVAKQAKAVGRPLVNDVMSYAKARGYRPAPEGTPAPAAVAAPAASNGNGAVVPAAAPAPAAPARGSVKDQLDAVRQNLDASRSLSDAGGSPGGSITPQQLADMPSAEFERYYAALKDSGQLDQMLGKPANM